MNVFEEKFPTLCELLEGTEFEQDTMAASGFSQEELEQAIESGVYALNELMALLYGAVYPQWWIGDALEFESNLAVIVSTVGIDATRNAFKRQLLVEASMKDKSSNKSRKIAKDQLEDVRYEVSVTAKACKVLDKNSIQLEYPIADSSKQVRDWKNSDIYGKFRGHPVRIEVTVLHEELPPSIDIEVDEIITNSIISSGFNVTLGAIVTDKAQAERTKSIIELLHDHHDKTGGSKFEFEGVTLEWNGHVYQTENRASPIERIYFYSVADFPHAASLREIIHPCIVRNLTPAYVFEDFPNPPGVVTSADLPDSPKDAPLSSKIRSAIERKLDQCEDGALNIVAFGVPSPMYDIDLDNALKGTALVEVPYWTDKHRVRHLGEAQPTRATKAPFVPEKALNSDHDKEQFLDAFRKLSAVLSIRLGSYSQCKVIKNPNALIQMQDELVQALTMSCDKPSGVIATSSNSTKRVNVRNIETKDTLWIEIVENFVGVCGSIEEARRVLLQLRQTGQAVAELKKAVDDLFSKGPSSDKIKFWSMTNEEAAMYFVIDCGGYEQAISMLEAYAAKPESHDIEDQYEE